MADWNPLINEFVRYLIQHGVSSEATAMAYGTDLSLCDRFLARQRKPITQITREDGSAWIRSQIAGHCKASTVIRRFASLRRFSAWVRTMKGIEMERFELMDLPKAPRRVPKRLERKEEIQLYLSLVTRMEYPIRAILVMLALTGARIGELLTLRDEHVNPPYLDITGKGGHQRRIRLSDAAITELNDYWTKWRSEIESPWLFPSRGDPANHVPYPRIQDTFQRLSKVTGIPWLTAHKLRHTYATMLRRNGVPLEDIADILGHRRLETTRIYAASSQEELDRQVEAAQKKMVAA